MTDIVERLMNPSPSVPAMRDGAAEILRMRAEIERLRAAVEESREAVKRSIDRLCAASQRRKMADAPMDGTSVLVINDRGQFVASWNETGPDYCLDKFWHVFSGKAWNDLRGSLPIAWQPLPSPPTQEGGG